MKLVQPDDALAVIVSRQSARVEPADISDRNAAARLLGGLRPLFPNIRTVIADAGHQSRKLAHHLLRQDGWKLQIVKRRQRAFKITGLTWIVERSFAWLGRNRRLSKDYEYSVQSSETLIEIAATRLTLNRVAPGMRLLKHALSVSRNTAVLLVMSSRCLWQRHHFKRIAQGLKVPARNPDIFLGSVIAGR